MPRVKPVYNGFEQGPIRPPSEAASLLLRVTRNCPWNRCTFCPVYKGAKFSLRPVEHVLRDIDTVAAQLQVLQQHQNLTYRDLDQLSRELDSGEQMAMYAAYAWLQEGVNAVFLQDANSLVVRPNDLVRILEHLRGCFPSIERVTSYARSQTIDRIKFTDLQKIAAAGLNRIHVGLESGADEVLQRVQKGTDQAMQIRAGQKVKAVGIELSEYVMPGLGGRDLSAVHAEETAAALNLINPDFIRLRTLALPNHTDLCEQWQSGQFIKMTDHDVAREIRRFLTALEGISSRLQSDHILNLFQELEGQLPDDKLGMIAVIDDFLQRPAAEQMLYQVGRRLGMFSRVTDLDVPEMRQRAVMACHRYGITMENVDTRIDELMKRFI
ncbi:radical SAM protein [uncultured Desulfuromusa sp.]|uniref:radical SAM protein n=1 Tax=uncultured Desulfuromusa sp. TaxID=219183 RepID=UPI002AA75D43|nr:radical SAM protein [uncultured Desulfuromusa sp.]